MCTYISHELVQAICENHRDVFVNWGDSTEGNILQICAPVVFRNPRSSWRLVTEYQFISHQKLNGKYSEIIRRTHIHFSRWEWNAEWIGFLEYVTHVVWVRLLFTHRFAHFQLLNSCLRPYMLCMSHACYARVWVRVRIIKGIHLSQPSSAQWMASPKFFFFRKIWRHHVHPCYSSVYK